MPCTIAGLAQRLQLPGDYLPEQGLTEHHAYGGSVRIPYVDANGQETGARLMRSFEGPDQFRWLRGVKIALYGLGRIANTNDTDAVTLVVNEPDCWALWWEGGFQAVGLPGVNNWKEDRDAVYFARFNRVYVAVQSVPAARQQASRARG
jgi:hypothetical protein